MGRIIKKYGTVRIPSNTSSKRCTICIDSLPSGSLCGQIPCGHNTFCYKCILQWAEVTNKCPLCQQRFNRIAQCTQQGTAVVVLEGSVEIEDRDQQAHVSNPTIADVIREIRCVVCGSDMDENIMLLCDQCDKGFHTSCIDLDHIPNLELWFCALCILDMAPEAQELQAAEMKLAAKAPASQAVPESAISKRKRIRRGADMPSQPRLGVELRDYPAGYFETCDDWFDQAAAKLKSSDW